LSVQAIADELGISRRYLHKILSESGTNFTALLEQARLERAALILRDRRLSRETIAEIAWACGFSDPSYFTRRFARRFGRSPKDYRRILD
jgi:AraC family transcriptional activator of tynA and feaB